MDIGDSPWLLWLAVALLAGTVEVLTLNLVFLMFAGGAVAAAVADAFGASLTVEILVFAATSGLLLLAARPPLLAYLRRVPPTVTGTAALVGTGGEVLVAVSRDSGRVKVGGEVWSARSATGGLPLEVGSHVKVVRIDGATAVVAPDIPRAALGGAVPPDGPVAGQ